MSKNDDNNNSQPHIQHQGSQSLGKFFAIAGMVLGIIGLAVLPYPYVSIAIGIVGTILSCISDRLNFKANIPPLGFARAGMVCGILSIILGISLWAHVINLNINIVNIPHIM